MKENEVIVKKEIIVKLKQKIKILKYELLNVTSKLKIKDDLLN